MPSRWCSTETTLPRSCAASLSRLSSAAGRSCARLRTTRYRPAVVSPWRMTEISTVGSMLPPERSATAGPSPPALPESSAATPTAPAPSTTSFVRSSKSTIASQISSSVTEIRSSSTSSRIAPVVSPTCLTAIPSAIVGPSSPPRPQRKRDPRGEPAAADRDDDGVRLRNLLGELETDRPLAGNHELVLVGMDERRAGLVNVLHRRRQRVLEAGPGELRVRAVGLRRLDLRHRRVLRHEHRRLDALL